MYVVLELLSAIEVAQRVGTQSLDPKFRDRALNNWPCFAASKLGLSRDYLTALKNTSAPPVRKRRGWFMLSV